MLAPGVVSNLVARAVFTSLYLTWCPPEEPNGVIISYKVIYSISNNTLNTINTTALQSVFTIPSLMPGTMGHYKTWTLDYGLDRGLDSGPNCFLIIFSFKK